MKIVFLSITSSENDHISFYEELLQEFVKRGHEVYAACASEKRKGRETRLCDERNIHVLRIKTGNITKNKNLIEKGISTVMIDEIFKKAVKKYFKDVSFDLIIYPTPPITLVGTIEYLRKKNNAVTYLLLKDIFPQNAIDLNMLKKTGIKGIAYKFFRSKEKRLYNVSDVIGCMSPANEKYVIEHNEYVSKNKVEICPNCILLEDNSYNRKEALAIREKYDVPTDKIVFVYGGNLGKPQGMDFFLQCLSGCKDIKKAFILIVGGGSETNKISDYIKSNNISNAKLIGTLPKADYELLANACDVGLVFLDFRFSIPNFPSRILSYMQTSKPVIVASDPVSDMGDIVERNGFGWKCLSNDVDAFCNCVRNALSSNLTEMGTCGREFLEQNYSVEQGYSIIMKHFEKGEK